MDYGKITVTKNIFGDSSETIIDGKEISSVFGDEISEDGFLFALDTAKGRVFQYDPDGNYMSAFGGKGLQKGCFQMPVALESAENRVFVADESTGSISLFCATEYAQAYQQAVILTTAGLYDQAEAQWQRVLQLNSHNEAALTGLGMQAMKQNDITTAMSLFKRANNSTQYSRAFDIQRVAFIRENLIWLLPLIIILIIVIRLLLKKTLTDSSTLSTTA